MAKEQTVQELQAEIERLQKALGQSEKSKSEAEEMALAMTQANTFLGSSDEQATGRTIKQSVCINPWERDEKKQKFKDVEVPTYYYTIHIPAGVGLWLMTNGVEYFHGQTYEVTPDVLADLKSRVARCYDHEKSIHGENKDAYIKPTHVSLVSAAARARGAH